VRVDIKEQGDQLSGPVGWAPNGGGIWKGLYSSPENVFWNFQLKMKGFNHFVAKKLDLWPETGTGGLTDPLGAEYVKCMGVENLAGVQSTTPTPSTRALIYSHKIIA